MTPRPGECECGRQCVWRDGAYWCFVCKKIVPPTPKPEKPK